MRKIITLLLLAVSLTVMAEEKISFVIEGSEQVYNQIRVINRTSAEHLRCRVVLLNNNDHIEAVYGDYDLSGYDDSDSHTMSVLRGQKIGVQFPQDFTTQVTSTVEYRDYPFFDIVVIYLYDIAEEYNAEF